MKLCFRCARVIYQGQAFTRRRRGRRTVYFCPGCAPEPKGRRELYLDHDQAHALLEAARERETQDELLVLLGLYCGLRASELVVVRQSHFEWPRRRLWVRTLKRKGHPDLPVHMGQGLSRRLESIVRGLPDAVFDRKGWGRGESPPGPPTRWWAAKAFKRLARAAGLPPRLSIHSMRHYCAIWHLEETGDLFYTREQLRHQSIRTTERYLHLLPERARRLAGEADPFPKKGDETDGEREKG